MNLGIGWVALIATLCFTAGVAATFIAASFSITTPNDGDTSELESDDDDEDP